MLHRPPSELLRRVINVLVIGCGGTGTSVVGMLALLNLQLRALGHPGGLHVTVADGDSVSETNLVRQTFSRGDVGLNKAIAVVNRLNMFYGFTWAAIPQHVDAAARLDGADLVISCVDTRAGRGHVDVLCSRNKVFYWLDLGNDATDGQYVLGQPLNEVNRAVTGRLPTVAELYPEICAPDKSEDLQPACGAAEALRRQAPFINQSLAVQAMALLGALFTRGIEYHGQHTNLVTGKAVPILLPKEASAARAAAAKLRNPHRSMRRERRAGTGGAPR